MDKLSFCCNAKIIKVQCDTCKGTGMNRNDSFFADVCRNCGGSGSRPICSECSEYKD